MYKLCKKINDKWQTLATIRLNKWDKPSFGMRCTPELKQMIADIPDGGWFNLAVFDDKQGGGHE